VVIGGYDNGCAKVCLVVVGGGAGGESTEYEVNKFFCDFVLSVCSVVILCLVCA
jgi:hypothetical protein